MLDVLSPLSSWNEKSKSRIWATNVGLTLDHVQLDTVVTYVLAEDGANQANRSEVTAFLNFSRDHLLL